MAVSYSREELGRGISLTRIYDKKFKSNCVKIAFISPLDEKTACVNAMLQTVLVTSNAEIPSRTKYRELFPCACKTSRRFYAFHFA